MIGEEIRKEIDNTLDQLIRNAEVISEVDISDLSETEVEAFKKTQESLIQHLLHMDQKLADKQNCKVVDKRSASFRIQEKRTKFETLKTSYSKSLEEHQNHCPMLSKRKSKRIFDFRGRTVCAVMR